MKRTRLLELQPEGALPEAVVFQDDGIRSGFHRLFQIGLELLFRRAGGLGVLSFGIIHLGVKSLARFVRSIAKEPLEQLFGLLPALLGQANGFVLVLGIGDQALLMEPIERFPVVPFPGASEGEFALPFSEAGRPAMRESPQTRRLWYLKSSRSSL